MPDPMPELSPFYPKWINTPDKRRLIVHDEEEEAREMSVAPAASPDVNLLGVAGVANAESIPLTQQAPYELPVSQLGNEEAFDPRAPLRAEAEALGIKVDGRWSIDRLRAEIKKASDQQ